MATVRASVSPLPASGVLMDLEETATAIRSDGLLAIEADETLLRHGHWLASSIPCFTGQGGGETTRDKLFVTALPVPGATPRLCWYSHENFSQIELDPPVHGLTVLIVLAFSEGHSRCAREAPGFEALHMKPIVGWIAGVHQDDLGSAALVVVHGETLSFRQDQALAIHMPLPESPYPRIEVLNLYQPDSGDEIRFPSTGFSAQACFVNGRLANLTQYPVEQGVDTRLPLVADDSGAMVNVSFKAVDAATGHVDFYAPVFDDVVYRIAQPVSDCSKAFAGALPPDAHGASWSCNCILNYLYGGLEGQHTGPITGPMTFGEIAYQLLNQTMVYVSLEEL